MPRRPKNAPPAYCLHKSSNRAYVNLNGQIVYLGTYESRESREKYDRLVGEWLAGGRTAPRDVSSRASLTAGPTVSMVIAAYWEHAQQYYPGRVGSRSCEATNIKYALRPLRRLYGATPVVEFGALKLEAVRNHMIELGWTRRCINKHIGRIPTKKPACTRRAPDLPAHQATAARCRSWPCSQVPGTAFGRRASDLWVG